MILRVSTCSGYSITVPMSSPFLQSTGLDGFRRQVFSETSAPLRLCAGFSGGYLPEARSRPQFQQRSNVPGFSSPQCEHLTDGPLPRVVLYFSIIAFARSASAGSSTQICGKDESIGSSPARLEAFALKMRARTPPWVSRSRRRCASGRLVAVWTRFRTSPTACRRSRLP